MLFNFVKLSKMYAMRLKKNFAFRKLAINSQSNKIQNYEKFFILYKRLT